MDSTVDSYRRFLQGDNSGLEEIICVYKDGLILYLNGIVRDISVAEELTEETFVKLVLKHPGFSENSSFKTWLYAIARNLALDYLRRSKQTVPLDECPEFSEKEACLEQAYIQQEEKILLHRTIEKLKPEYRQVLWLRYFEGFSHKQIARIMRRSAHNIETLAYRAKRSLKTKLQEEGFVYEDL